MRRALLAAIAAVGVLAASLGPVSAAPAAPAAAPSRINGGGSTYVALAMQQWVAAGQGQGLDISYTPMGSPDGLDQYRQGQLDFAGTEAEFASIGLGADTSVGRGFQYIPDVGGAVAIMYNVDDRQGHKVDYLHLSRHTIARIFMGDISWWDDPAISADNKNQLILPHKQITVVYRSSRSGTTALFYDFVQNLEPGKFQSWAARNGISTRYRLVELPPTFAPKVVAKTTSDEMAAYVAGGQGKWSITYDEFGYADVYHANAAWVDNEAGKWVLPYARNISEALVDARLRPDLSQELSGVYVSRRPEAYPISAYSYIVSQCARASDRATCKGNYGTLGRAETLKIWLRYIACQGQANLPVGYSPLPPNLSQEMANSIGRMYGTAAERLTAGNCNNPRFRGQIPSPPTPSDPLAPLPVITPGSQGSGTGNGSGNTNNNTTSGGGAKTPTKAGTTNADKAATKNAAKDERSADAIEGGTGDIRDSDPVNYKDKFDEPGSRWPMVALLGMLAGPPLGGAMWKRFSRTKARRKSRPVPPPRPPTLLPVDGLVPVTAAELAETGLQRRPGSVGARWSYDNGSTLVMCRPCIESDPSRFAGRPPDEQGGLILNGFRQTCSICAQPLPAQSADLRDFTPGVTWAAD